jgi:hypothetical protein
MKSPKKIQTVVTPTTSLKGKVVVVKDEFLPGKPAIERLFRATSGFGTQPEAHGTAIFGIWLRQNTEDRIERWMVERLATPDEIEAGSSKLVEDALRVLMGRIGMDPADKAKHEKVLGASRCSTSASRSARRDDVGHGSRSAGRFLLDNAEPYDKVLLMNDGIVTDMKRSEMFRALNDLRNDINGMVEAASRRLKKGPDAGDMDTLRRAQAAMETLRALEKTFTRVTAPPKPADYTLHIRCKDCGHKYDLKPVVAHPDGSGTYSSDMDFCVKCGSSSVVHG